MDIIDAGLALPILDIPFDSGPATINAGIGSNGNVPGPPGPGFIEYTAAVTNDEQNVVPGRYYVEPSAFAQSLQDKVYCAIMPGRGGVGAAFDVYLEVNGVMVPTLGVGGIMTIVYGTPFDFTGLNLTVAATAQVAWVITSVRGDCREVFCRSSGKTEQTVLVAPNVVQRSNLLQKFNKSVAISPQEYDAVGDDSTDNKTPLTNWIAACAAEKLVPIIPPGVYRSSGKLDFSACPCLPIGAGPNNAILKFTNAADGGVHYKPSGAGSSLQGFGMRDIGIQCTANVARAFDIQLPNGNFTNDTRIILDNIEIKGVGANYFGVGLYERNVAYSKRTRVKYWGSSANPTANAGYYDGVAFDLDTQLSADDPALGLTLENIFDGMSAAFCHTGLRIRGYPEGIYLRNSNLAFVRRGVDASAVAGTRQPLLSIKDNHINAAEWGIRCERFNQSQFCGNHISRPGDNFGSLTWKGIELIDSIYPIIGGNHILPEASHLSGSGLITHIDLSGDSWFGSIFGNMFLGSISGSYKSTDRVINIQTGVSGTKIAPDNQYSGGILAVLNDGSGNNTNNFTGLDVQRSGVQQGRPSGITQLNFGAEFVISASPDGRSLSISRP